MHAEAAELDLVHAVVAGRNPRHQLARFRLVPLRWRRKVGDDVPRRDMESTLHLTLTPRPQTAASISRSRIRST